MKTLRQTLFLLTAAALSAATAFSQDAARSSSSLYLPAWQKADVTVPFALSAEGHRFQPTWGLDLQWNSAQNIRKGINHMGKDNIGIGRTGFRSTKALVNDSILDSDQINMLRSRSNNFNLISTTLPLTMTADQEAGSDEYYVKNKSADVNHWAAMINSHVHWMQQNTQHPIVGISPFNEPDYWTVEEGATAAKQMQVAKLLKENYPRCKDIPMVGGNTLNNDKALSWYTSGKAYYDWGNTHQLAGSFDTFAGFFQQLQKDGKVGYADEMHNVGEAMIGLEYGMTVGIWWGFDSRARGEFCQISRHGERLAYAEHRNNWTAASVYRHDDGRVKAFVGSSERQANTTNYQFVSTEREVYYDGYGPVRDYFVVMPGGTGYQTGQTNAECVVNVTWGEDVPPAPIRGTYKIVNKVTGNALAVSGSNINQQIYKGQATQQWNVSPISNRIGGDFSFYDISSVSNAMTHINVRDYSTENNATLLAYSQNKTPTSNEQWYLEYYGDGYYYIRNRESALYVVSVGTSKTASVSVRQMTMQTGANHDKMLWRFLPVDVDFETVAPAQPQGLVAEAQQASVRLSWTANAEDDLAGYMLLRADKEKGDWNTIARKLTATTYVDNTCRPGHAYIYKVKAIDKADNQSACSDSVLASPTGDYGLVAHWNFDENLYDDTRNMMDAVASAAPTYVAGHATGSRSISLATGTRYLQLPYEVAGSDELTITLWVKWTTASNWQRIFDFGNGTDHYMFLTPSNGYTSVMRFAIKDGGDEQTVDCRQALSQNVWKHVAVVVGKGKTSIYIDGEEAAQSTGVTIKPSDFHPVLNYIGRSQFAADPYFRGCIDDLRIYNYALDAAEVKQTMQELPSGIALPAAQEGHDSKVYGLDGRRQTAPHKGLQIVDGRKVMVRSAGN